MNWKPIKNHNAPHTGILWAALGLGILVVTIQHMQQRPHQVVSARHSTNMLTAPVTNAMPPGPLWPKDATNTADPLSAFLPGWTPDGTRDIWELIGVLRNLNAPLDERRLVARLLAQSDDPLALAFLSESAKTGSPRLRAIVAESLGHSTIPAATELLEALLADTDPTVARGAVRALTLSPSPGTTDLLGKILNQSERHESVRTEAALALGSLSDPQATQILTEATRNATDESLLANIWEALGMRPTQESAAFVSAYLESSDTPTSERIMALEALGSSPDDVSDLLMPALRDPDPDVREASAWALSMAEEMDAARPGILTALAAESDAGVRLRLYQALENQPSVNHQALLPILQGEAIPEVRLAGFQTLSHIMQQSDSPESSLWFDSVAVPVLQETALQNGTLLHQMNAVTTLARAGSPIADEALLVIAEQTEDPRLARAAIGMKAASAL